MWSKSGDFPDARIKTGQKETLIAKTTEDFVDPDTITFKEKGGARRTLPTAKPVSYTHLTLPTTPYV